MSEGISEGDGETSSIFEDTRPDFNQLLLPYDAHHPDSLSKSENEDGEKD